MSNWKWFQKRQDQETLIILIVTWTTPLRYKSFKDKLYIWMTQRIPLKEEKHYQEVNQPQDGKEIPIFYPKEEKKKKEGKKERDARPEYLMAVPITCSSPSLATLWPQTLDWPSSSSSRRFKHLLKLSCPSASPLVSLFSASPLLPGVLPSSCRALGRASQAHGQSWRPPRGEEVHPLHPSHVSSRSYFFPYTQRREKKPPVFNWEHSGGKKCHFAPIVKYRLSAFFFPPNRQDKAKVLNGR